MYESLSKLSAYYSQDFETIFESKTEPIDAFCEMYELDEQKQLVSDMELFLKEVVAGTKNANDLTRMGMEYNQSLGGSWDWFREAIAYLKKKIAEG
ncbi:MAG: hypothetical protein JWO68_4299 [Actinomycetia bacterium]|jgi:hypothetical protein|nr:hypothetical protein [Actinomycetes bacterium]